MPRADGHLTNKEMSVVLRKLADSRKATSSGEKSTASPLLVKRQK